MSDDNNNTNNNNNNKIKALNILNVVAYVANVVVTFGVGVSGYFPTNAELSDKYQTLVTPAGYAFSIWGIIFLAQLIWTILQVTSKYRSNRLVVNNTKSDGNTEEEAATTKRGVGYLYVAVCVAQCLWTIMFAQEFIPLSLAAMLSILVGLVWTVERLQTNYADDDSSILDYWLLKFPFHIHCGWIWAASLVNFNVVLVAQELSADILTYSAWASLGLLPVIAVYYFWKRAWVVPMVLAWASYAIHVELSNPREAIVNAFDEATITNLQMVSEYMAYGVLGLSVLLFLVSQAVQYSSQTKRNESSAAQQRQPLVTPQIEYNK